MIYHIAGFLTGFILDLIFGDPRGIPHIVIAIGKLIAFCDRSLLKINEKERNSRKEFLLGVLLVLCVITVSCGLCAGIMRLCLFLNPLAAYVFESLVSWQLLACRDLKTESMPVYDALNRKDITGARTAVSRIVGRDTGRLDEAGITRAAVETVAENLSDGVIAPMLFLALAGPVGGMLYKAVNTMDSMVGYKNDRYMHFGTAAARLDDILNFIPSRVSAILMIMCCIPGNDFNAADARHIFLRDRFNHKSPNSAQTESVAAGALGVQLGGDNYYFGKLVHKKTIGDAKRQIEAEDIKRVNVLMYRSAVLAEILCLALLLAAWVRI